MSARTAGALLLALLPAGCGGADRGPAPGSNLPAPRSAETASQLQCEKIADDDPAVRRVYDSALSNPGIFNPPQQEAIHTARQAALPTLPDRARRRPARPACSR